MKKILSMALAVVMMMAMAVPVFAADDAVANVTLTTNGATLEDGATIYVGDTIELEFSVSNVTDGAAVSYKVAFNPSTMSLASATFNGSEVEPTVDTANYNLTYTGSASGTSTFRVVFTITKTFGADLPNNFAGFEDSKVTVDGTDITVNDPEQGWDGVYYVAEPETSTESTTVTNDNIDTTPHASIEVIGKLDSDNDGTPDEEEEDPTPIPEDPTIAVDIYWTDMVFSYSQSWDDTNLTYVWNWTNGEDYIRVDNRSSVGIDANIYFTGDSENGYGDDAVAFAFDAESAVEATWENDVLTLGYGNQSAAEDEVVAPSGTLNVNVADTTTMDTAEGAATEVTLGQITINISVVETGISEFPTDETLMVWLYQENQSADSPAVYTVKAGQEYTIGIEELEIFPANIKVTDDTGSAVTGVTVGETQSASAGYGMYIMTKTFTCDTSLVGQAINFEFVLLDRATGTEELQHWYFILHVVE